MLALVLVDFDNIEPSTQPLNEANIQNALAAITEFIISYIIENSACIEEIHFRFYGGWIDEAGYFTERAECLRRNLHIARGRQNGLRINSDITISLAAFNIAKLIGTLRRGGRGQRQKMVDSMMTADAIHLSDDDYELLIIMSDDDDLLPAAITSSGRKAKTGAVHLLRARSSGQGLNDSVYINSGGVLRSHGIIR